MKRVFAGTSLALLCSGLLLASLAQAQGGPAAFPSRPVRIVVPFAAGGATDIVARLVGAKLGEVWRQAVVVDNRPGASGAIGSEYVARSPADGYTLVLGGATTHSAGPAVNPKLPYDNIKDFAAVSLITTFPNMLVVHPSVPARTLAEFIAFLKANPNKYNFASTGSGGSVHLAAELFMMMTGTRMTHVPYKGSGQALADLLAGTVQCEFDNMTTVFPHVQSGKLRALGVAGLERSSAAPSVPAIAETLPGFEANSYVGLLMPAGSPAAIVRQFADETRRVVNQPDVRQKLQELGATPVGSSPEEFAEFLKTDTERWRQVVKSAGIKLE